VAKPFKRSKEGTASEADSVKSKRAPDLIEANKAWVIEEWLRRVTANTELIQVHLSEAERKDHVPDLLDEAIAQACGYRIRAEERQKATELHGTLRYHQGYSVPMIILEAQILQRVIAECLRDHFLVIDLNHLIPDIAQISETISSELRESLRAYMNQYEWHEFRTDRSPRQRGNEGR
jgi:hypothetical protein